LFTNISGDLQAQVVLQADRASGDTSEKTVALTLSSTGSATDLARLGFNTELKIDGEVSEDLIVFTTGGVGDTADLSASYTAGNANPLALRSSQLQVVFSSSDQYQIQDVATGTVLADRSYVENQSIDYQQLRIDINGEPQAGNVFTIDNNQDGFGSNENLLRLVALENQKVLGEDDTLHESYLNLLNRAGSTARQAQVTQEALQVVYNQAYEARDQVVGVNLDEEAADLIRFQQAYQASAKLIQTANQLFDSILRL
jgi:flagellar hook-associated protein FlgK